MNKTLTLLFVAILPVMTIAAPQLGPKEAVNIDIQHSVNGGDFLPKETLSVPVKKLKSDPLSLLQLIRSSLSSHLKTVPVQIDTKLTLPNKLPTVSITTKVDKDNNGISDITVPTHKIPLTAASLNWKSLNSHLTFTGDFINLKADTHLDGITINSTNAPSVSVDKINVYSAFDSTFKPIELNVDIPSLEATDKKDKSKLTLQSFTTNFDAKNLASGLKVGNLDVQLKHINFTKDGVEDALKNLRLTTNVQEQGEIIGFNLKTTTDKINLSTSMATGLEDIVHAVDISVGNLDIASLLALQTKYQRLHNNPMAAIIMLGELMKVAPKLLAKSPKIELHQLLLQTSKGKLQGNFIVNLDGKKANSLSIPTLIGALHIDATVKISKKLLKQVMFNQFNQEVANNAQVAADEQIKSYLEKKILVEIDDNYQLIAKFENGKLFVNGQEKPIPLP
ncbi:DUF945 family protein [Thiotrichales bacterium HSG1]|nr:DUF945 family protein [Thiotrichales bacterium HSG1]